MPSYQYRTILRPSYLHSGISYTGKMTSLYLIRALVFTWVTATWLQWEGTCVVAIATTTTKIRPVHCSEVHSAGYLACNAPFCFQEKATKWYSEGEIDGLTTNGVLIMHPVGSFSADSKAGIWREVSVNGGIYGLRESRSTPQKSSMVSTSTKPLPSILLFWVFHGFQNTGYWWVSAR